jgi:hypothetical protein
MLSAELEPEIPASEPPQTHALDCAITDIGPGLLIQKKILTRIATQTLLPGRTFDRIMNKPNTLWPQKNVKWNAPSAFNFSLYTSILINPSPIVQ